LRLAKGQTEVRDGLAGGSRVRYKWTRPPSASWPWKAYGRHVTVRLVDFTAADLYAIERWFDDSETQRRLGGREWVRRAPSLLDSTIGDDFRGKVVTGRWQMLALDESDAPVAFIDAEGYDRYAAWDGSDWDHPVISDVVEEPSVGLTVVVDPDRRKQGYGVATIRAVIQHPSLADVCLFFASIEADNMVSIACFERAGFRSRSVDPDFEGMLYYSLAR
jgi:RimJ/RimL family protein N-acetyltransferase